MNDKTLVETQYATDAILTARADLHRQYTVGPSLEEVVDRVLALAGDEALLDVGTGPGWFPVRLRKEGHRGRLVGADVNAGMLPTLRPSDVEFVTADAGALPFPDATFDVVTARHMLYHVRDIPAALREFRRVLRPGGTFLAVTNARDSLAGFWDSVAEAGATYPPLKALDEYRGPKHFSDHNAADLLRSAFGNVFTHIADTRIEVPNISPIERYFLSCLPGRPIDPATALPLFRKAIYKRMGEAFPWVLPKSVILLRSTK